MVSVFVRMIIAASILAMSASAAYYSGQLNITGDGVLATDTFIDFQLPVGGGTGDIQIGVTHTGSFSSYVTGSTGTVKDIPPVPSSHFFTFPLLPVAADWALGGLVPQAAPTPCPAVMANGDSCVGFAGSPVLLTKTGFGTLATLNLFGTITDSGDVSAWTGIFSAQFVGLDPATVAAQATAGGTTVVSWSGNIDVVAPEPGSVFLGLTGLVGIVLGSMRRRKA